MSKIWNVIKNPYKIIYGLVRVVPYLYMNCPDRLYLKLQYRSVTGKSLDLKNPKTFNDKLMWLKLNDRKSIYTTMVDKYAVKEYVSNIIGESCIIPTLGVWDSFDDIDFSNLPNQFVLKCTHDSGGLVICKDKTKFDFAFAKEKIEKSLRRNFYYMGREWPYMNVRPRIIAEKYMVNSTEPCAEKIESDLVDYKFYCFNGKPMYCQVITNRSTDERIDFFDMNWKHQEFTGLGFPHKPFSEKEISMPSCFSEMVCAAQKLASDIPYVRIDFYEINGNMYFGEITFYPASGLGAFEPSQWNEKMGSMLKI